MLNQNHNVHKRTNSKILLILLCIFGLLFSYSCSCRNKVTGPGNDGLEDGRDTNTIKSSFTATPDTMNNLLDLYIQSDNTTNSVVIIKFKSEQNISAAKIIEVKHKSGTTDVGLTKDELGYSLQDSKLQLGDNDKTRSKIATALTKEGETSVITLTMELTSDSANLNNTITTVDVDVNLIKAIKLNYDKIYTDIFKNVGVGGQIIESEYLIFSFSDSSASYKNDEISIKNVGNP